MNFEIGISIIATIRKLYKRKLIIKLMFTIEVRDYDTARESLRVNNGL